MSSDEERTTMKADDHDRMRRDRIRAGHEVSAETEEFPLRWQQQRRIEYLKTCMADLIVACWDLMASYEDYVRRDRVVERLLTAERIQDYLKRILACQDEIIRLRGRTPGKESTITPEMIERARNFPIEQLITFNRAGFALCPWHREKTPSLRKHRNANIVYCFGCHGSADPIKWVRQMEGLSFPGAVKRLQ
jgi:hypothetical protein